jgi:predicted metal-dependent hydrolase
MGQIRLRGNPEIAVFVRRSARAQRVSLRLSALDGRATLTLPVGVREAEGQRFLKQQEGWLRARMAEQPAVVRVGIGAEIPFQGRPLRVVASTGRNVCTRDDVLLVPGSSDRVASRLQGWVRAQARDVLSAAADRYSAKLGLPYTRLTLRDPRSRWGSCTAEGALMFSWRLVFAPPQVLDYVAAHEVAHLQEMHHGRAFWRVVEALYGDWQPQRDWLRQHGAGLHRYRFGD